MLPSTFPVWNLLPIGPRRSNPPRATSPSQRETVVVIAVDREAPRVPDGTTAKAMARVVPAGMVHVRVDHEAMVPVRVVDREATAVEKADHLVEVEEEVHAAVIAIATSATIANLRRRLSRDSRSSSSHSIPGFNISCSKSA